MILALFMNTKSRIAKNKKTEKTKKQETAGVPTYSLAVLEFDTNNKLVMIISTESDKPPVRCKSTICLTFFSE